MRSTSIPPGPGNWLWFGAPGETYRHLYFIDPRGSFSGRACDGDSIPIQNMGPASWKGKCRECKRTERQLAGS